MKRTYILLLLFSGMLSFSQNKKIDSLRRLLKSNLNDTSIINNLNGLAFEQISSGARDSSLHNATAAYLRAKKSGYRKGMARAINIFGLIHQQKSEFPEALKKYDEAIEIQKEIDDKIGLGNSWHNIGFVYYKKGDFETALKHYETALKIREGCSDRSGLASSYINIGLAHMQLGDYAKAISNYLRALKISEEISNERMTAMCYSNIGDIYQAQGNAPLALKNYFFALKTFEKIDDKSTLVVAYNTIGSMYYSQKNYAEAIRYSNKALQLATALNDKTGLSLSYSMLGLIYMDNHEYDKALKNFMNGLKIDMEIGDTQGMAISYENIGSVYFHLGRFDEAAKKDSAAFVLYTENDDKMGIAQIHLNSGGIDMIRKKYKDAEAHFLKSIALAKEMDNLAIIKDASERLSVMYETMGNLSESLKYYREYTAAKDSLFNESNVKKIVELEMNYDFDKKEAALKAEQEKKDLKTAEEKRIREFEMLALLVLLVVIIVIGWLFIRQNKLKAGQQAMQLEQQLLRSQMNPHFIFNSLIAIESFIYNNEPKTAGRYLSGFARLMRLILENSRKETVTLAKEIEGLENYLQLQRLRYDNAFDYKLNVSPELETDFAEVPPMLAQPFIENAIEHGLRDIKEGGLIEISFSKKDNNLLLEIRDNGTGIHQKTGSGHQSLATTITKERIELFNKKNKQKASFSVTDAYPLQERKGVLVQFILPVL